MDPTPSPRSDGDGGMGEVHLARPEEPIRRTVTRKPIRPGIESKAVVARLESERQARAIDAGTLDDGRPYLVLEYVAGIPIPEYRDRHGLTTERRLGLLAQVCGGLHHAHQTAIVHRDVEPSNVLVTEFDGALTRRTLYTELGQGIGTPEYRSRERADHLGDHVDRRTDIESVGVLPFDPFDPRELRRAGIDEILRRIRVDDPPRSSTRLGTLGDGTAEPLARRRATRLRRSVQLRGALDWITRKALEECAELGAKATGRSERRRPQLLERTGVALAQEPGRGGGAEPSGRLLGGALPLGR